MKDQVFISYRRDGGEALAQLLHDRITEKGYAVFYDIESLKSGPFDTKLYQKIEECDDFILVLPPQALDRCIYEEDWVRCEIKHALKMKKNIIPVIMRGFIFPQVLPEDIQAVSKMNGVEFETMGYLDAKIEKIISMFNSNSTSKTTNTDDQMREHFNKIYENIDSLNSEKDKTALRKKLEHQQYVNHVLTFISKMFFTESTKTFGIRIDRGRIEINAPAYMQFFAVAIFYDYYNADTFTYSPRTSVVRFEKETEISNHTKTIFKLAQSKSTGNVLLISVDIEKKLVIYIVLRILTLSKRFRRQIFVILFVLNILLRIIRLNQTPVTKMTRRNARCCMMRMMIQKLWYWILKREILC